MQLDILNFFRENATPFSDNIFLFITNFGGDIISTLLIAIILWCVNKDYGKIIAFSGFLSFSFNGILKDIFSVPRPMTRGVNSNRSAVLDVTNVDGGYSSSFPSGHSQSSATLSTDFVLLYKKRRYLYLLSVAVFLIGLSRVVLGIHYPLDVLCGWALGILIALCGYYLCKKFGDRSAYVFIAISLAMLPAALFWSEDTAKSLGGLLGFSLGCLFEQKFVGYQIIGKTKLKLFFRLIAGCAILLILRAGLSAVFLPDILFLHYLRYAILMFVGAGLYPYIFNKLNF